MEKASKLPLAEQFLPPCLGSQQAQAKRRGALCIHGVPVPTRQISKDLPGLFVGDAAVSLKPIPGTRLGEVEFFKPPNQRFMRYAKGMGQQDDVPPSQLGEAKARLGEIVRLATAGQPQRITVHGKDAVVIVAADAFEALRAR